jgi:hypothetical protein
MKEWMKMGDERPHPDALVVFYVPNARYVWASGVDYDHIKVEFTTATHWRVVTEAPGAE